MGQKWSRKDRPANKKNEDSGADVRVDKEAVGTLLQEIAQLLESDLTEAMNRLEALNRHPANSSVHEEFKRLKKPVESSDTDTAV